MLFPVIIVIKIFNKFIEEVVTLKVEELLTTVDNIKQEIKTLKESNIDLIKLLTRNCNNKIENAGN